MFTACVGINQLGLLVNDASAAFFATDVITDVCRGQKKILTFKARVFVNTYNVDHFNLTRPLSGLSPCHERAIRRARAASARA